MIRPQVHRAGCDKRLADLGAGDQGDGHTALCVKRINIRSARVWYTHWRHALAARSIGVAEQGK
jgi:ornithine cyclodeaminase/alanine dehydrogenase-like protein (mu-crystallin family)